ncbi:hypothetical protein AMTRI_Chr04g242720 [Amborella trichopoda]
MRTLWLPGRIKTSTSSWKMKAPTTGRRRKMPLIRLGNRRRSLFSGRLFRGFRLRWLRLQSVYLLKRLRAFYFRLIKDLADAGASTEVWQQRVMMETYFVAPVLPRNLAF